MNKTKIEIDLVTYDGTDETLPREYEPVLVSGNSRGSAHRVGRIWAFHTIICGYGPIQKGDRWGYIPEIEAQEHEE